MAQFQADGREVLEPPAGQIIYGIGQDGIVLQTRADTTNGELTQVHEGIAQIENASGATPNVAPLLYWRL